MTKQRRSFSAEFKREAADLVLNYSYIEASRSLGVGESALAAGLSRNAKASPRKAKR